MLDFVLRTTKAVSAVSAWVRKLVPGVVYQPKCDRSLGVILLPFPYSCQFSLCSCGFRSCCNRVGEQFPAPAGKRVKLLFSPGPLCLLPLWALPSLRAWFPLSSGLLQEPLSFLFCVRCDDKVQEAAAQIQSKLGIDAYKECWLSND